MASTDVDAVSGRTVRARPRRFRSLVALAAVLVVAVAVCSVVGYRTWRYGAGDLFAYAGVSGTAPLLVGQTMYQGADIQPRTASSGHQRLDVRRVSPRLTVNTARASVRVLTCAVADPHLGVGTQTDLRSCRTVRSFTPGTVDLGFPATEVVYEIRASRAGTLRIEGADVSYRDGSRSGVQHAGSGVVFTAHG